VSLQKEVIRRLFHWHKKLSNFAIFICMKIKKGDNVIVIAGSSKGKKGKVVKAIPSENKVVVEGVNMRKKSRKATKRGEQGQILEIAMPIHVSNVAKN
jgi:large subunit ribosomal protein L24